jgi:hypothetical protein
MRRFGILTLAAGVWVGSVAHAQGLDPQAHGAVAGGTAAIGPPPPPPTQAEPAGPDLPVAVGISAGTATFLPGGGKPAGGGAPPSRGGAGGGGGGGSGGGSGGGGTAPRPDGLPILPAPTPPLMNIMPDEPTLVEDQPSVGGPQELELTPAFFPPPPPPPPPPPDDDGSGGGGGGSGGGGGGGPGPGPGPGPVAETPEPATLVLAGVGAAAALGWRRRRT